MRVPNLEELVTQGEQEALPESRLKALIAAHPNRSMGDETLLNMCREALDVKDEQGVSVDYRGVNYARRGPPTDEGHKLYHRIVSFLMGRYPGLGTWPKEDVLDALSKIAEAGL